ncbi:MAG: hypothetical protein LBS55_10610 [Prevotellaceae bacterium]|jgi:hypothetical protein|nr:hypothetical protein [Prevotellaceae bacterium]
MRIILLLLLLLSVFELNAQIYVENTNQIFVIGSLREYKNLLVPVRWAKVELKGTDKQTYADGTGYFAISGKGLRITPDKKLTLIISADGYETMEYSFMPGRQELGVIFVKTEYKDVNPITVNDLMPDRPEINGQTIGNIGATALFWNDDALAKATNLQLGMHGFKMRGYDWRNTEVYLNGASFNDPETGYAYAGLLNGFIDITKKNTGNSRLVTDKILYGDIGGYSYIELNPLKMYPKKSVSYISNNSLFTHSLDALYSTGEMASGWALGIYLSSKLGEGFIKGTKYEAISYLFSAGKDINDSHSFSFFAAGSPTKRRQVNYSTQTVSQQNIFHQPLLCMSHEWEGDVSSLNTSVLFSIGNKDEMGLDTIKATSSSEWLKFRDNSHRTMISFNSVYDLLKWRNLETTAGIEAKLYTGRYYNDEFWDYSIKQQSYKLWNIWRYYMHALRFSLGASISYVSYNYTGNIINGKVEDSVTIQPVKKFFNYSGKAGVAYKFTSGSDIEANVMYSTRAPLFSDTYLSPHISGNLLPYLRNEKILATEVNYSLSNTLFNLRASAFFTLIKDQSLVRNYFDNDYFSYFSMGISQLDSRYIGGEVAAKFNIVKGLKADFAVSYGVYKYVSNPNITLLQENINEVLLQDTVSMKGLFIGNTPQLAITAGGIYESPLRLWLGFNVAYTNQNHSDINPVILSNNLKPSYNEWKQTGLNSVFTLNVKGGYVFVFGHKRKQALSINIHVQNLLNSKGFLGAYSPFGMQNRELRYAHIYGKTMYLILKFLF